MGALLLDVGRWNDFGGQVEPFTEVVKPFGCEGVIVVLPGELGLKIAARGQRLAGFDNLCGRDGSQWVKMYQGICLSTYEEILRVDVAVLGEVGVLLGHEDTLTEEVFVDFLAVRFWDKPVGNVSTRLSWMLIMT